MPESRPESPAVWAVLLAAGRSQRFGAGNKLLADIGGEPMVARVARQVIDSRVAGAVVVAGHEAAEVAAALAGLAVRIVENPGYREGLASSLRAGLAAVPAPAAGALVCVADMPGLTTKALDRLLAAFAESGGDTIVYTRLPCGAPGNPVVWPRRCFAELAALTGDQGARPVLLARLDEAVGIAAANAIEFQDIDTAQDLANWTARCPDGGT